MTKKGLAGIVSTLIVAGAIQLFSPQQATAQQQIEIFRDGKYELIEIMTPLDPVIKEIVKEKLIPVDTPSLVRFLTFEANTLYSNKKYTGAAETYGKILYLQNGKDSKTLDRMVDSYLNAGKGDVLATQAELLTQDFPKLKTGHVTKEIMDDIYAKFFSGDYNKLEDLKKYDVEGRLATAEAFNTPKNKKEADRIEWVGLYVEAKEFRNLNDYENVKKVGEKLTELNNNQYGFLILGESLIKLNDLQDAKKVFEKGLKYTPNSSILNNWSNYVNNKLK